MIESGGNKVREASRLMEMESRLRNIWIDWSFSWPQSQDMKWACKMKRRGLKILGINSQRRIKERKLIECMKKKHQTTIFTN